MRPHWRESAFAFACKFEASTCSPSLKFHFAIEKQSVACNLETCSIEPRRGPLGAAMTGPGGGYTDAGRSNDVGGAVSEVREFRIDVGAEAIADLKERLRRTRWPEAEMPDAAAAQPTSVRARRRARLGGRDCRSAMPRSLQPGKHPRPLTRKEVPAIPHRWGRTSMQAA